MVNEKDMGMKVYAVIATNVDNTEWNYWNERIVYWINLDF